MPQIPLQIGKMSLGDDATKGDTVLCHLYNGYRVDKSLRMIPNKETFTPIGSGSVFSYYSTLHDKLLVVCDGRLFSVDKLGVKTEITGCDLTLGVRPSFTEDKDYIFLAALSEIHRWTPGAATAVLPRRTVNPLTSAVISGTTDNAPLHFSAPVGLQSTASYGATFHYSTKDKDNRHYKVEVSTNDGATWSVYAADETPGDNKTITLSNPVVVYPYGLPLWVRLTLLTDDTLQVYSPKLTAVVVFNNLAPVFTVQPTSGSITKNGVTLTYTTEDNEDNHYSVDLSLDNGETWTRKVADESDGAHSLVITGLSSGTTYRAIVRINGLTGNGSSVTSNTVVFTTTTETVTNEPNKLSFSVAPAVDFTDYGATITYTTEDEENIPYKVELSKDGGGTWVDEQLSEMPGEHSIDVAGLNPNTAYNFRLRLTTLVNQSPRNVTSLDYISGYIIAKGDSAVGDATPGDIWFSDKDGYTAWEMYNDQGLPDAVQAVLATFNSVYGIGRESVEVSVLTSDPSSPFAANKNYSQPFGTPAPHSVAFDGQSIYYMTTIGENRRLARLVGGQQAQIISFDVDIPIDEIEDVSDAYAEIIGFRGETFYLITFPTANVTINDQVHSGLTLAFSTKEEEWYIWGEWNDQTGEYTAFNAASFAYIEPWHLRLVGGRDGNLYKLIETERDEEPMFQHRWRNDYSREWRGPRTVSLGKIGDRKGPVKLWQFGQYTKRQDEWIFVNGGVRMAVRTGWRNWGKNVRKSSLFYVYDVKRGDTGIVFNGIEEEAEEAK